MRFLSISIVLLLAITAVARAELPAAITDKSGWSDWSMAVTPDQPGDLSADALLEKPAGRNGPIVVRNGHFFSGDSRVRFWGINIAFAANFPAHEQAYRLARRFARYGINAVRFHHMDNQPYPNGIFADSSLTTLSPVALERLDYFLAELKSQGIYADINLHVSRNYNHYHKTPDGQDGPRADKMVDIFDPDLITAQMQYARDLLGHVNPFTHLSYAADPCVGIVEINNENSLFMWDADRTLMNLPPVYQTELGRQWNRWLVAKYTTRETLQSAWAKGEEPIGDSILTNGDFAAGQDAASKWFTEQQGSAAMKVTYDRAAMIDVKTVDGTDWHLQFNQPGLHLKKGAHYTLSFNASGDQPMKMVALVGQAHSPWESDGLTENVNLSAKPQPFSFGFTVSQNDDNARLSFSVGQQTGKITLSDIKLCTGGRIGLIADEDPRQNTVKMPNSQLAPSPSRSNDWYDFLQQTEEKYYTGMMNFLKTDVGVKCPITGTIGFGPLGTLSQSKMDFVDAHAYWEHPSFPHRQWDMSDWRIGNQPMVDHPDGATLWNLAATRVAGKPFTVTEYEHPAPNDWQAECIPLIATYAAAQDWDGVFLFAYSHDANYDKDKISSFFDIEGNPTKMPQMPMGARLFDMIKADESNRIVVPITRQQAVENPMYSMKPAAFLRDLAGIDLKDSFDSPAAISFTGVKQMASAGTSRVSWKSEGAGTGRFVFADANAAVFVGFSKGTMPLELGNSKVRIESMQSPFAAITIAPATPDLTIANSDRLLITAIARAQNTNMQWNSDRTSISNHWGNAPAQIEVVQATISLPGRWNHVVALDAAGNPTGVELSAFQGDRTVVQLGSAPAIAYEAERGTAK